MILFFLMNLLLTQIIALRNDKNLIASLHNSDSIIVTRKLDAINILDNYN